jgi:hypothetical protein
VCTNRSSSLEPRVGDAREREDAEAGATGEGCSGPPDHGALPLPLPLRPRGCVGVCIDAESNKGSCGSHSLTAKGAQWYVSQFPTTSTSHGNCRRIFQYSTAVRRHPFGRFQSRLVENSYQLTTDTKEQKNHKHEQVDPELKRCWQARWTEISTYIIVPQCRDALCMDMQ